MDAVPPRLCKRPIRDLIHPDRTRRRPIHLERLPSQRPAPVCPHHRIAGALYLSKRSQKFRRDDIRRVLPEDRSVLLPRLVGSLVKRAADRQEQLRWLAHDLIGPIGCKPKREGNRDDNDKPRGGRRTPERSKPTPTQARARPEHRNAEAAPAF